MNRLKKTLQSEYKMIVYTLCSLGLCWIDLWRGIGNGAQWAIVINFTGFCIFPMIALRLDWRMLLPGRKSTEGWHDIYRIITYIWLLLGALLSYPAFKLIAPGTDFDPQITTAIINVILYGIIAIRVYFCLFHESANVRVRPVFALWLVFLVFAIISINVQIWPLWFLVMFGSFYLIPLKGRDLTQLVRGIVNGLILGFFLIQGRAFLYRPYDGDVRYRGHYTNPNVNAMFYMFTYIAWLIQLSFCRTGKKKVASAVCYVFASSMWVFIFLTGCRSAILGVLGTTLLFWICESKSVTKKKIRFVLARITLMCVLSIAAFYPVFLCIRYIPPLRHHPVWYQDEYSEDRVMSWDPIDSPKYNELGEVMTSLFGRFSIVRKMFGLPETAPSEVTDAAAVHAPQEAGDVIAYALSLKYADAGDGAPALDADHFGINQFSDDGDRIFWYEDGIEPGDDPEHPIFPEPDYESSFLRRVLGIRYYIYRFIFSEIRFFGNPLLTPDRWILTDFMILHAHNSALMMTYWFGPVAGLAFLAMVLASPVSAFREFSRRRREGEDGEVPVCYEFTLLVMTGYILIGLMECIAFPGEMGLVLVFLSLLPIVRKGDF